MTDIPAARKEIERIDAEIIRLVAARQECARVIGENKRAAGTNVFVPEREEALLRKLENIAAGLNIPAASIRAIFREIISASVALQMDGLPVVYLGPEGTFTHQAARKNFGGSVRLQPLRTIAEIFEAVERGKAGYGVIPIENSNAGAVTGALDMLAESDLKIIAQIQLAVEQCLISRAPLEKIERVLSKDLGLAQCSQWLMHHLPNAALIPTDSTAAGTNPPPPSRAPSPRKSTAFPSSKKASKTVRKTTRASSSSGKSPIRPARPARKKRASSFPSKTSPDRCSRCSSLFPSAESTSSASSRARRAAARGNISFSSTSSAHGTRRICATPLRSWNGAAFSSSTSARIRI